MIDWEQECRTVPVRVRCAMTLRIAREMLPLLTGEEACVDVAKRAIQVASSWVKGGPMDLDLLSQILESEDEPSVMMCMFDSPLDNQVPWLTVGVSMAYITHHAFAEAGIHSVSEYVDECNDALLNAQMSRFDELFPERTTALQELFLKAIAAPSSDSAVEIALGRVGNLTE